MVLSRWTDTEPLQGPSFPFLFKCNEEWIVQIEIEYTPNYIYQCTLYLHSRLKLIEVDYLRDHFLSVFASSKQLDVFWSPFLKKFCRFCHLPGQRFVDCFAAIVFQLWLASAVYKFVGMRQGRLGREGETERDECFAHLRSIILSLSIFLVLGISLSLLLPVVVLNVSQDFCGVP